ncbi:glycoside hydrolase, partial [Tothia fuscella]
MAPISFSLLLALVTIACLSGLGLAASGTGYVTHYWDCCKPSCAWPNHAPVTNPVQICDINDHKISDQLAGAGCTDADNGKAYMCSNQTPWATDDFFSFGFAAVNIVGQSDKDYCCSCYSLTFTSGKIKGKKMIVQATNTGFDLNANQFDIAVPGGGVGNFNGCWKQWNGAPTGDQFGGFHNRWECDALPDAFKWPCYWRFDWYQNADGYPTVDYVEVPCPQQLIDRSGCWRK